MSEIKVNSIKGVGASAAAITVNNTDGTCTANITNNLSNRNLIINGSCIVAQRGTSQTSITSSGYYTIDRYKIAISTGTITASQSTDVPTGEGFAKSFKVDVTTADTSLGGTDFLHVQQAIEGQDLQGLAYGTSSAKNITLSFFVKSNKTGIYCICLEKSDNTRYDFTVEYTISSANTWEKKTITIAPDSNIQASAGAIDNDNGKGFNLKFVLAAGGDRDNGVNNTWNSSTPAHSTSNQVNLLDSTSNEWYLTGVQLEVGSVATDFEHRSFGQELALCQRYYYVHVEGNQDNIGVGAMYNASLCAFSIEFPVSMRATPSLDYVSGTGYYNIYRNGASDTFDTMAMPRANLNCAALDSGTGTSGTEGVAGILGTANASAYIAFAAEL